MPRPPKAAILILALRLALAALLAPAALAASFLETPTEFQFLADLDGDGRDDIVILDKASGGFRAGYQFAPDVFTWAPARPSGMTGVTGVAAGRFFATDRDALAVVSPAANRTHIVRAATPSAFPIITPVFGQSLGPVAVAAPDIGGPGNTVHADLWVVSAENGAPNPRRGETLRHNGTGFSPLTDGPRPRLPVGAQTVSLKDGAAKWVVFLDTLSGQADRLSALSLASGSAVEVAFSAEPEGSAWTSGKLGAGSLHHVLTWVPGSTVFRSLALQEGPPNNFSFAPATVHELDHPIGFLAIAASGAGPRLIAVTPDGSTATVHAFNGLNPLTLLQEFAAMPGQAITGLIPLPNGGFHLFEGTPGTGVTAFATPHTPDGGTFEAGTAQSLPGLRPAALRANVFAFTAEPFIDPTAILLAQFSAPEWTSQPTLVGDQLSVLRETFGGTSTGLGSKAAVNLGSVPMGTAFALTSQFDDAISVHSFESAAGPLGPTVEIDPLPGRRSQGFYLSFQPSAIGAPVSFRLNNGPWEVWSGQSIFIFADTDVAYFIRHPITFVPSAIQHASYRFDIEPHLIDSDGDGIPDFVEDFFGLDPLGGVDTDGDGFTDLNELVLSTDPNDPLDRPALNQRLEDNTSFRMRVAPRPIDGTNGARTVIFQGQRLEVFALDGTSLGGSASVNTGHPDVVGAGHVANAVQADPALGLVTIFTEPNFQIATINADKDRGREIAGLFFIPEGSLPEIAYTPGGGTQEEEANAWLTAAALAYVFHTRPTVFGNWTELDTLAGLILERKIEEIFLARGLEGLEPGRLTLFGGRRGDAGRFAPSADDLRDLRHQVSDALPGFDVRQLYAEIQAAVAAPGSAGLRNAATMIYRVSSLSANDHPPGTYLPPFDVLRSFVRGAPLPEPYASEVGIAPATLAAAQGTAATIANGLPARPVESFTVVVQSDSFVGACRRVLLLGTDHPVNLFAAPGVPYTPPIGFTLLPGTKVHVTGYTDLGASCSGTNLELVDIIVLEFPPAPVVDANENLIPDDYEWAFLITDPFGDDDGDGISNLQEILDGTDPLDPNSKGEEAVNLSPPPVQIALDGEGGLIVYWNFPPAYADAFGWLLETSPDLVQWTSRPDVLIFEVEPGLYGLILPDDLEGYYRVQMLLK
ncbi:MAG: hypothetical protein JJT96_19170 [Opitutales bacterium]|nr:hypothetical protein [Opitutales bacterium]